MVDYSNIDSLILKENHNLLLGFIEGYVPLKVTNREMLEVWYDPKTEIGSTTNLLNIAASTFITKQFFSSSSSALGTPNLLKVSKNFHVYQVFVGMQPSQTRLFVAVEGTEQKELDEGAWGTNSDYRFGYIPGYASHFDRPGPAGEIFISPSVGMTWGVFNPMPYTISPQFTFVVNRLQVAVIKDLSVVQKMLQGIVPARIAPVGGGILPPKYNMSKTWQANPVTIDATPDEIRKALGVS